MTAYLGVEIKLRSYNFTTLDIGVVRFTVRALYPWEKELSVSMEAG
jgi:hypothetical protein